MRLRAYLILLAAGILLPAMLCLGFALRILLSPESVMALVAASVLAGAMLTALALALWWARLHARALEQARQAAIGLGHGVAPAPLHSRVRELDALHAALHAAGVQQATAREQFLAMLGHELRNPLAPIRTAAQLLRLQDPDAARVRYASELITRQVDLMSSVLGDMLGTRVPEAALAPPPPSDAAASPQRVAAGPAVMIVDDHIDAAISLSLFLEEAGGHRVSTYYDGCSALAGAQADAPDVLILDISLPDMTGYDLLARLRCLPHCTGALAIALTGHGQAQDRSEALAAGFDHHLAKPADPKAILGLLAGAIRPR